MIIAENSHLLGYFCKVLSFLKILRITFNPVLNVVRITQKISSESWRSTTRWYLLTLFSVAFIFQHLFKRETTPSENTISGILLGILLVTWAHSYELRSKPAEIECLLNALFQLHSTLPGKNAGGHVPLGIKMNVAFIRSALVSGFLLPVGVVYGLHCGYPCKGTLVGSWLIPKCSGCFWASHFAFDAINLVIKWVIFLINQWMWTLLTYAGCFMSAIFLILGVQAVHQLISRLDFGKPIAVES